MAASFLRHHVCDFDVDRYLNPWIPPNRLDALPRPISRFLGYREKSSPEPARFLQWILTYIATFAALCVFGAVATYAPWSPDWKPPAIIASLGASAILDYNTVASPLSQPRNNLIGNTLSAIIGVGIAKLFMLSPHFEDINWISGAIACATASVAMSITNTIHPPGGATAILASVDAAVVKLGWHFIPLVLMGNVMLVAVALLFNNVLRQYPTFWWTPAEVGQRWQTSHQLDNADLEADLKSVPSGASSQRTLRSDHDDQHSATVRPSYDTVRIDSDFIHIPPEVELSEDEVALLSRLQSRLRESKTLSKS